VLIGCVVVCGTVRRCAVVLLYFRAVRDRPPDLASRARRPHCGVNATHCRLHAIGSCVAVLAQRPEQENSCEE
jgi:hypothetical protein